MKSEIQSLIEPELYEALMELSQQDLIIDRILKKSNTEKEFINSLIAGIICISNRELQNVEKINSLLKLNPKIQEMIKETSSDKTILRGSDNS